MCENIIKDENHEFHLIQLHATIYSVQRLVPIELAANTNFPALFQALKHRFLPEMLVSEYGPLQRRYRQQIFDLVGKAYRKVVLLDDGKNVSDNIPDFVDESNPPIWDSEKADIDILERLFMDREGKKRIDFIDLGQGKKESEESCCFIVLSETLYGDMNYYHNIKTLVSHVFFLLSLLHADHPVWHEDSSLIEFLENLDTDVLSAEAFTVLKRRKQKSSKKSSQFLHICLLLVSW